MTLESQIESLGLQDLSARLLEEAGKMGDRDSSDHVLFAGKGKSGVFCTYCGRHGHREEDGCRTKKFREELEKGTLKRHHLVIIVVVEGTDLMSVQRSMVRVQVVRGRERKVH